MRNRLDTTPHVRHIIHILNSLALIIFPIFGLVNLNAVDSPANVSCHSCVGALQLASASEGWAYMLHNDSGPFILHLHNGTWHWERWPVGQLDSIDTFTADSPTDAWAIDEAFTGGSFGLQILHYHQGAWSVQPTSLPLGISFDLVMLTPTNGWLIANQGIDAQGIGIADIMHFDGTTFQGVATVRCFLNSLTFTSADNGWAVGANGCIVHVSKGQWKTVPSPTHADLASVALTSPTNGWAVGQGGATVRYTGGMWRMVIAAHTTTADLTDLALVAPTAGWATENIMNGVARLWHLTQGGWQAVAFPANQRLSALALPAPDAGWAIGIATNQTTTTHYISDGQGLLVNFEHGTWRVSNIPRLPDPTWVQAARAAIAVWLVALALFALWLCVRSYTAAASAALRSWPARIGLCGVVILAAGQFIAVTEPLFFAYFHANIFLLGIFIAAGGMLFNLASILGFSHREKHRAPAEILAEETFPPWSAPTQSPL